MSHTVLLTLLAFLGISRGYANPTSKIWDGSIVPIEEMPWMVQFEHWGKLMCGGVILSENFILTAAQCTIYNVNTYRVRAGAFELETGGSTHHVEYIYNHPINDLAVIKVTPPIVMDSTRQPIRFGSKNPEIDSVGYMSGWGSGKDSNDYKSQYLRTQNVTVFEWDDNCNPKRDLQFCGTGAFCYGDVGGPFTQDGLLLGLADYQHWCHDSNTYVSVTAETNRDFIMEKAGLEYYNN